MPFCHVFAQDVNSVIVNIFVAGRPLSTPNKSENSQMPRHLISDAHEWINEIPTVPIYYLAKPQQREWTL